MPRHLRGIPRAIAFTVWTLFVGGIWMCIHPFLSRVSRVHGGARVLTRWSRGVCRILGVQRTVSGELRRGPVLFAANHIGYLDVVVMASEIPVVFVAKAEVSKWPVFGPLGHVLGTIFLERERPRSMIEVSSRMQEIFACGQSVGVFPEGTTTEGKGISDLRPALFEPAFRAGVPIQGVFLEYTRRSQFDDSEVAWYGDATFLPHFYHLLCGRGWRVRIRFQETRESYAGRLDAAKTLQKWMESALSD